MRVYPSLSSPFPSLFRSLSLFLFLVRLVYKSNYVSASKSKTRFQGEGKTLRVSDWGAVSCLMYFWLNLWRENWICPALSVVLLVNKLTGLPSIARGRPGPKASHERERERESRAYGRRTLISNVLHAHCQRLHLYNNFRQAHSLLLWFKDSSYGASWSFGSFYCHRARISQGERASEE